MLGRGIGGALVVLVVLVVSGAAADATLVRTGDVGNPPPSTSAPATPATPGPTATGPTTAAGMDRLAEFGRRVSSAHGEIRERLFRMEDRLAAQATDLTVEGEALGRLAADERAWLAEHPAAECYQAAGDAWIGALGRLEALATQLAAIGPDTGTDALARVIAAAESFNVADLAFIDAFEAATTTCRVDPAPSAT